MKKSLKKQHKLHNIWRPTLFFALIAAILYSSWPLAYLLNPVSADQRLASWLQTPNQPYYWVFILLDVFAGFILIAIGYRRLQVQHSRLLKLAIRCYMAFGVLIIGAALVPIDCDDTTTKCGAFYQHPLLTMHAFFSTLSVVFLFASLVVLLVVAYKKRSSDLLKTVLIGVTILWVYYLFASLNTEGAVVRAGFLEDYFISVCSATVLLAVWAAEYLRRRHYRGKQFYGSSGALNGRKFPASVRVRK
jgi:hypothetical protein